MKIEKNSTKMKKLKLEKVKNRFQVELLPWMFGWYPTFGKPKTFAFLKKEAERYNIPDFLIPKVLAYLKKMSETGYETGKLVAPAKCKYICSDVKKVGDNLCLTHPHYKYKEPIFKKLIGVISEYTTTFSAGGGRVTAGRYDYDFYELEELGELEWVTYP